MALAAVAHRMHAVAIEQLFTRAVTGDFPGPNTQHGVHAIERAAALMADEDDDLVEISAEEAASINRGEFRVEMPEARGWTTPTFACHRHVSSCVTACCCPCVQFGLNQRNAFRGEPFIKWVAIWLTPLVILFILLHHLTADANHPSVGASGTVLQMAEAEVSHHIKGHLRRHRSFTKNVLGKVGASSLPALSEPAAAAGAADGDDNSFLIWFLGLAMVTVGVVGGLRRSKLRAKYGIAGSAWGDCLCHSCCHCCSLAKEAREIKRQTINEALAGAQQDLTVTI